MLGNIAEVPETHNTDCPLWCSQAPKGLHNLIRHLIMVSLPAVRVVIADTNLSELAHFTRLIAIIHVQCLDTSAKISKFPPAPNNITIVVFWPCSP
jgi:hypothetical protein